jgi:hypothetical protein
MSAKINITKQFFGGKKSTENYPPAVSHKKTFFAKVDLL